MSRDDKIEAVVFDLFGTIIDMSGVPESEMRHYGRTIRDESWSYFHFEPAWNRLPAFEDAGEGLAALWCDGLIRATLSNAPIALQMGLNRHNQLDWDALIPLEAIRVYKPKPAAYEYARYLLHLEPWQILMVSANKDFGDIEAARAQGMHAKLIRGDSDVRGILGLREYIRDVNERMFAASYGRYSDVELGLC
jgi:HAD superfamily hydrolase (TIGR01493 family)